MLLDRCPVSRVLPISTSHKYHGWSACSMMLWVGMYLFYLWKHLVVVFLDHMALVLLRIKNFWRPQMVPYSSSLLSSHYSAVSTIFRCSVKKMSWTELESGVRKFSLFFSLIRCWIGLWSGWRLSGLSGSVTEPDTRHLSAWNFHSSWNLCLKTIFLIKK